MIALPPFETGGEKEIEAWVFPRVATTSIGTFGTVIGVAVAVVLAVPWPIVLTAETRKSYGEPFISPVTIAVVPTETPSENVVQVVVSLVSL